MNVCFFTNEYPPNVYGGAGVHVDYLARELSRRTNLLVKCFGPQDERKENLRVKGVAPPEDALDGIPRELGFVFSAFHCCLRFFNPPFAADIVHCHTWYSHLAGILARKAYGIPLVVTTHSLEPLRPWKREQIGLGFDVSSWVESQALSLADAVIAVSRDTRQDILDHFPVSEKRVHVIPNGIDPEEFAPVESRDALDRHGVRADRPYVLFVGRITRQKGIIHLVNAIEDLEDRLQVVLLAGAPDTPEIQREMESRIRELKQKRDGIVWITDMLDNPDKIQFYSHASVFCCPSIYEPFGIINLEAMACETPVVATRTGGIPEVVVDGETGILVPVRLGKNGGDFSPAEPETFSKNLAEAVNRLVRDDALRLRMARESRRRAREVFSWKTIAGQVHSLYESLLSRHEGMKRKQP
jgi:glycogen synthase